MWPQIAILLIPLGTLLSACDRAQPPVVKAVQPKAPTAPTTSTAILPTCPEGHHSLKKVPVVYGLLISPNELGQKDKKLEFIPGGCVIIQGYSPVYNMVCEQCRYRMDPVTEEWKKEDKDPAQFQHALSDIIRDFPTRIGSHPESRNYEQRTVEGRVVSEAAYCWSNMPQPELRQKLYSYFLDLGVVPGVKPTPSHDGQWTFSFNINGRSGYLDVLQADGDKTYLWFEYPQQPHLQTLHPEATVNAN